MKIGIIVSSEEALKQAGVRIRYRRIEKHISAFGHSLGLHVVDSVNNAEMMQADFWVFSKCYDSRSVMLARRMQEMGKRVGADFFDDIFSQQNDSRLTPARSWIRDILPYLDFGMCSTPRMAQTLYDLLPKIPIHILNDPINRFEIAAIARNVREQHALAWETKRLAVAWFGVGDNPRFPVGLSDLVAFDAELRRLETSGFSVDLTILTNQRSLTRDGLELLSRLPVSYHLELWSEQAERKLLNESLIAFLPVNAQNFSMVKSLNRAVSALSRGCQILSVGHDLYQPLHPFLYRSAGELLADLQDGQLKVRPETLGDLADLLHRWSSASVEAGRLLDFLSMLPWRSPSPERTFAILNGLDSPGKVHKMVQQMGGLSVALPFTGGKMNYDLAFSLAIGPRHLELQLSKRAGKSLSSQFQECLYSKGDELESKGLIVEVPEVLAARIEAAQTASIAMIATLYEKVVQDVADIASTLFPLDNILLSEVAEPVSAYPLPSPAIPIRPVDTSALERVLIVANGEIPSLDIFFRRPLEPLVSTGQLRTLILHDRDLRATHGREWAKEKRWERIRLGLDGFDPTIIVFCRYSGPLAARYIGYARDKGIGTIFQIDDDLFHIPETIGQEKYAYHTDPVRMSAIQMLLNETDLVYASTPTLARSLATQGIDNEIWTGAISAAAEVRRRPVTDNAVDTIGFMGGGDHGRDLEAVAPAIATIMDRYHHVRFELFSSIDLPPVLERFGDRISRIEPVADYAAFYAIFDNLNWDIGLCPLERTPFNASKAVLKWVEYTSVGIATIASRGTAYDECSSDGCGLLADSMAEWVEAMDRLITEEGLCFDQVMRAQKRLCDDYSPAALHEQTRAVIESVLGRSLIKPAVAFA